MTNSAKVLALPLVSIVTPSFNQGQFLEETILSVLQQEYQNVEYIIIDGGSTDNSLEVIKRYEHRLAYWVSEKDCGQADAINKGFQRSTGQIVGWLNSDDLLYPAAIKDVVNEFQRNSDLELIYGDVDYGPSTDAILRKISGNTVVFKNMMRSLQVPIPQQGSLWKRSVLNKIGHLNPRWHVVLDRDFFIRAASECKLLYLPMTLGLFRDHNLSKSSSQQTHWLAELPAMYDEFFTRKHLPREIYDVKEQTMGMVYITCASIAFRNSGSMASLRYLMKAISADPLVLFRGTIRQKIIGLMRKRVP